MYEGKVYISRYPDNPPEWYWIRGLHDAWIIGVEEYEFPFDYYRLDRDKSEYDRNLLILRIDAKNALGDTSVKEIRLHNYEILFGDISLENREKLLWLADRLTDDRDGYALEIDLWDNDLFPDNFTAKIKFERAEVYRR